MAVLELQVLNGDQVGLKVNVVGGTYRVIRRSAENFEVRSTLVSSSQEQWRLGQEDLELASAKLSESFAETGATMIGIDHFERSDDVAIWDERMSQPHAMLLVDENRAMIVDMGSRNGSFVNGERVGVSDLKEGDLLRCGTTRLHVHIK